MRNFNYTARDKSGAMKSGSVQAAARTEALHELTAQGLVPLSVTEGMAKPSSSLSIKPAYAIVTIIVLLAIGFAVKFFLLDKPQTKTSVTKQVKTTKVSTREKNAAQKKVTNEVVVVAPDNVAHVTPQFIIADDALAEKKPAKTMIRPPPTTNRVIRFGGAWTNQPPTGFTSRIDYAINQLASTQMGMPPPPLIFIPPGEDVKAALERSILVYDTDTDATIEKKAAIAQAKQAMKDFIAQGGNPNEFTNFYHKQLLEAAEERQGSQKMAMDLFRAGEKEAAALYIDEQNKKFAEKGYVPISIPVIFQGDGLKGEIK
jgi:hypothetical protein